MKLTFIGRLVIVAATFAAASCGSVVQQGTGSSFLIINNLEAASGAEPEEFGGTLYSDVITVVEDVPTIFSDPALVTFSLGLKDATTGNAPTQNQFITLNRYSVRYIRADGRNTPGVDVPYGFDGALSVTVDADGGAASFEIVRHIAKKEAPLRALAVSNVIITTIAEITFYGRDLAGHEVSVVGRVTAEFGNFGDPQ
jgi:hypothetical protein